MEINHDELPVPELETRNGKIVKALYKALTYGNRDAVAGVVANDIEWWYHGPPHCQHMMRMLTGKSRHMEFKFKPRSITAIGDRVIVEGWEGLNAYWVHVWTLKDGMITQFREYFNTWLTVLLRVSEVGDEDEDRRLWQSKPRERPNRSLPDLLLAI